MSVNPGFSGQEFIDSTLDKISEAREIIDTAGRPIRLEVDGGVKIQNIGSIAKAGADTFVSGSAVFGTNDYAATITAMRKAITDSCS
jgi:ribulose-phosphate 3-epimerase